MSTTRKRHLVEVWNPSYAADAMTAHLTVLLESARGSKGTDTDPYVSWGKVRSRNRQQELKHLPQILEIAAELARDEDRSRLGRGGGIGGWRLLRFGGRG